MSLALKLALAPLLVAQAIATRRRALVLPEAGGPREGRVGPPFGPALKVLIAGDSSAAGVGPPQGAPLRLLIAGDSSAAGVGVARQCDAVAGYLTRTLHQRLDIPVAWALRARSGLTTLQVHDLLKAEPAPPADVAVVITGVNDVIDQVPTRRAVRQREALAAWLLDEGRARHVLFAPLPPIHRFPLLPQPLRRVMGADARRHDEALARWAGARENVSHIGIALEMGADMMAEDGFHPGEPVYRICGEALALHIAEDVWPALNAGPGDGVRCAEEANTTGGGRP